MTGTPMTTVTLNCYILNHQSTAVCYITSVHVVLIGVCCCSKISYGGSDIFQMSRFAAVPIT